MKASRRGLTLLALAVAGAVLTAGALAGDNHHKNDGFKTAKPSMLTPVAPGSTVTPLITVGDTLAGGYRYESIPDGISFQAKGGKHKGKDKGHGKKHGAKNDPRTVDLYINHETSFVPFPYTPSAPTEANSQNDFDNSQESHLVLNGETAGILSGEMVIKSAQNYQRFCSNFLATKENGFNRPLLFTNEEGIDWVKREGRRSRPRSARTTRGRSASSSRYDPKKDKSRPIWGMGRFNHENNVAVPGYGHPVLLSGDDAFVERPGAVPGLQLHGEELERSLEGQGRPLGVRLRHAWLQRLRGLRARLDAGHPGPLRRRCRRTSRPGANPDGTEMMAADAGYPPPRTTGWQTVNGVGIDGPQWVLEHWSDLNDVVPVRRGSRTWPTTSGRGCRTSSTSPTPAAAPPATPQQGRSTNGRIWKMVLDRKDPTKVTSLSILDRR